MFFQSTGSVHFRVFVVRFGHPLFSQGLQTPCHSSFDFGPHVRPGDFRPGM